MQCTSKGGQLLVVLLSMACAGSPPNRAPEPHASAAPFDASAAPPPSSAPEGVWTSAEDEADRDNDQIADSRDRCPDEPERYNGVEDDDGCPDKGPYYRGEERIFMTFEEHEGERKLEDNSVVEEVVKLLAANPDITL